MGQVRDIALIGILGGLAFVAMFGMPEMHGLQRLMREEEPQRYMSSSNIWAKDYAPSAHAAPTASANVYYRNCDAARAAGAAPIRIGQPGYRPPLDRDGDGVACERWR